MLVSQKFFAMKILFFLGFEYVQVVCFIVFENIVKAIKKKNRRKYST